MFVLVVWLHVSWRVEENRIHMPYMLFILMVFVLMVWQYKQLRDAENKVQIKFVLMLWQYVLLRTSEIKIYLVPTHHVVGPKSIYFDSLTVAVIKGFWD
jgi:hypothetical protein